MRRVLAVLAVVHAAGCDRLLNLEHIDELPPGDGRAHDGATVDGLTKGCSQSAFPATLPVRLEELANEVAGDPAVTDDGLELYFVRSGVFPYEIWRASRAMPAGTFELDVARLPFNIPGNENSDPSFTSDGSMVFFVSRNGSDPKRGYQATREVDGWTNPSPIPGLEGVTMESSSISADGLTLYFAASNFALMQATRHSLADTFDTPVEVAAPPTMWPTVSVDGLEIFFSQQNGGIYHGTRSATDEMFGSLTQPFLYGADPYLMRTSTTMWIAYDTSVAMLERVCP